MVGYFQVVFCWIDSIPDLSRSEKSAMFITHQLHGDLQRTCHSMHDMMHEYVKGNTNRRWVPMRFSQDPLESFFLRLDNQRVVTQILVGNPWIEKLDTKELDM